MPKCFACMYACIPHVCLVSMEAKMKVSDPLELTL